ncbi:MAG TPA: hypothetical protein VH277_09880 [Gemmatimonadaceae bacterium]|nr:hypothetical protein [Gemmatimonadaceae bacterium]
MIALLSAGAFAAITLSQRTARLAQNAAALAASADFALTTVLASPAKYALADLPFAVTRTFVVPPPAPHVTTEVAATRLVSGLVWLVSDASLEAPQTGHRRVALIARFSTPGPSPPAPILTRGQAVLGDSVVVSAETGAAGEADCRVVGAPLVAHPLDTAAYYLTARQLAMLDSMPSVRHVRGDTTISNGSFDGVMIVDGSVTVTGAFSIVGLLVARGTIMAGGTLDVTGALAAFGSGASAIQVLGGTIRYNPCATARALRHAAELRPVRSRGWSDLF